MAGQHAVHAEASSHLFPQVTPLDARPVQAPSRPVQGVSPGAPEAGPGRVSAPLEGRTLSRPADTPSRHGHDERFIEACPSCLADTRTNLDTVLLLTVELPAEAANGWHAYHTHEQIPGGDALVMLTPALHRTPVARKVTPELPNDPRPPLDVLGYWATRWAHATGRTLPPPPTLGNVGSWLDGQLHLIAQQPLFPHLAHDLKRLVHSIENVLHAGHRPEVSRVPCWDCGTRLVKVYADNPIHDHWRCPGCGEHYDRGRYDRAQHDHLASRGAERYVPVSDAAAATGRSPDLLRRWAREQLVDSTRDPTSRRLLVWWPDVRARHLTTQTRNRRSNT